MVLVYLGGASTLDISGNARRLAYPDNVVWRCRVLALVGLSAGGAEPPPRNLDSDILSYL